MQFSLCITNHNRYESLVKAVEHVLDDQRISEIVIADDCSLPEIFGKIKHWASYHDKIKLFRNPVNMGMSRNKCRAIELATNPRCIIFDSDNSLSPGYLDAMEKIELSPNTIYMPDFAMPRFDYRKFSGIQFHKGNVKKCLTDPVFNMLLNTCNYLVPRDKYLEVFHYNDKIKASDTIWFNYLWLKAGYIFHVVPGMQYTHTVHDGSGFLQDADYNMKMAEEIKTLIKNL